ncbi:hypothetical protein KMB26_32705 [Streptomyces sp. CYG20]|nr:hypothetical protein [Streptomyces sp. CYG20]
MDDLPVGDPVGDAYVVECEDGFGRRGVRGVGRPGCVEGLLGGVGPGGW